MKTRHLLVVDDQTEIGDFVRNVAEGLGYSVTVTDDPLRFAELYRAIEPDTLVLDIFMPERDGIELLKELALAKCKSRILFISGSSDFFLQSATRLARDFGLPEVKTLRKPLRLAELRGFLGVAAAEVPRRVTGRSA